ncbi:hypothetical protein RQP46_001721 [Phenoliferia psychrophenolica]
MGASSTVRFALVVTWICSSALQYGFHISALNSTQDSIICSASNRPLPGLAGAPTCVHMTTWGFGVVTAAFTLGGFFSSVVTGTIADRVGRKRTAVYSAWLIIIGGLAMTIGSTVYILAAGRFIIGLACGIATVLVPLYLSEVAPPAIRGSVGVLTQLSICIGIFFAQVISIPLSALESGNWRFVTLVSAAIAFTQVVTAAFMIESPQWLAEHNPPLFNNSDEETAPLAPGEDDPLGDNESGFSARSSASGHEESMSIAQAISSKDPAVRKGLITVLSGQFFQQGSGINAVMYYSTGILSTISQNAKWVTLFTTLVNVFMTLPAVYFVERLGRRALLLISLGAMSVSSIVLAYSINNSQFFLASVFIVMFVASFSVGLGPIPFLLLGEVPPVKARSACASAALGTNWSSNFFIGLLFLPLRNWLSGGLPSGEGTIFYDTIHDPNAELEQGALLPPPSTQARYAKAGIDISKGYPSYPVPPKFVSEVSKIRTDLRKTPYVDPATRADPEKRALFGAAKEVRDLTVHIGTEIVGLQLKDLDSKQRDELALLIAERSVVDNKSAPVKSNLNSAKNKFDKFRIPYGGAGSYGWHTDLVHEAFPPGYTHLHQDAVPDVGGDTLWASGVAAYDKLSPKFRSLIDGLNVIQRSAHQYLDDKDRNATGWKTLFVNRAMTVGIEGLDKSESDAILNHIHDVYERSTDIQVRWSWTPGTSALWDNRATIHTVSRDYGTEGFNNRHGTRVSSLAEKPFYDPKSQSRREALQLDV